jgi:hypothetical protein
MVLLLPSRVSSRAGVPSGKNPVKTFGVKSESKVSQKAKSRGLKLRSQFKNKFKKMSEKVKVKKRLTRNDRNKSMMMTTIVQDDDDDRR